MPPFEVALVFRPNWNLCARHADFIRGENLGRNLYGCGCFSSNLQRNYTLWRILPVL